MARLGFGIIGCGNIGPVHAEALSQVRGAKLVAVSDVVEQNARTLAEKYGASWYTDYRRLLDRKDVDAVCLCVPSGVRGTMGETCAAAGKHILAEKPLEINTRKIDRLIEAAAQAGVKLGCVFQSRFAEGAQRIRKAVEQGRFGRLVLGDAYIKWFRSQEYYDSSQWRGTWKLDGGGALINQGIHQVDLLLWFMGPAKWVRAESRILAHDRIEVEDLACATIQFENGALGVIEASTAIWPGHAAKVEIHGSEGSAVLEDGELRFWQFRKETKADARLRATFGGESALGSGAGDPLSHLKCEGHRRQIQDFVKAIQEDRPPFVDGPEGRRSVALIEAIYKSAATGKTIKL
ncbi:MAG TPA: Gfo/Idh/MocA family oxidoreductase [Candidatus Hydrogenedentes bacterium]|nr:Gfo/Idh/MocA family oxidoreductase [Candidatus Hydrogenedentota bacterium]HOV73543.1 Gfo/Idh/MocA family oxidoreductase [Candidatus Hydrogenedentota bacterium]HPC16559.1 Gfo/Idh/MocA family oxidoreductase [Candidatus Hydrogenedentota bacterium]HRT18942.1 Gfo/Idh/MocA family oxidoreductase [Candidatus Hydrogenedentota bacterium]HRT64946.1 Gfo/Idh/MocA family oxidoreductase [Candidatus Hydrogenedentota bacterium]